MGLLEDIVALVPQHWDRDETYVDKRYILVDIEQTSPEYSEAEQLFFKQNISEWKVIKIQRVQHPFMYASYNVRKEQLQISNTPFMEKTEIRHLGDDMDKVQRCLDHSCDWRNVSDSPFLPPPDKLVYKLLMKILTVQQNRSTDHYPQFLVTSST